MESLNVSKHCIWICEFCTISPATGSVSGNSTIAVVYPLSLSYLYDEQLLFLPCSPYHFAVLCSSYIINIFPQ